MKRSHVPLSIVNLKEMQALALIELKRFLYSCGTPEGKFSVYKDNLLAICLCQGAAQHYIDYLSLDSFDSTVLVTEQELLELEEKAPGIEIDTLGNVKSGIQDVDIWFFFKEDVNIKIPDSRNCRKQSSIVLENIGLRNVDFLKKTIGNDVLSKIGNNDSISIIKTYLKETETATARYLQKKSIIGLYPDIIFGNTIWKCKRTVY